MNILDIIIGVLMAFFLVRGIYRGFFREIGSLAGVILGIWLAKLYQAPVTAFLGAYLPGGKFLPVISFALIFLVILAGCNLLGRTLKGLFAKALLGGVDRFLGGATAVLKGGIIIYFAIFFLTLFLPSKTPFIAQSQMAPVITGSCPSLISMISPDAYREWKQKLLGDRPEVEHFSENSEAKADDGR
ncbi:MAG: CvpA family protein [Desulfatiglandaceae bacterium]